MIEQKWDADHVLYKDTEWINTPSEFSQWVLPFLPKGGELLDLGSGQGRDSRFFAVNGFAVKGVDFSSSAIALAIEKSAHIPEIEYIQGDITKPLLFESEKFDVVYAS